MIQGPKLFNSLPKEVKEHPNKYEDDPELAIKSFKKVLDKYLQTIPDEPNSSGEYSKRMKGINNLGERTNSIIQIRQNAH